MTGGAGFVSDEKNNETTPRRVGASSVTIKKQFGHMKGKIEDYGIISTIDIILLPKALFII